MRVLWPYHARNEPAPPHRYLQDLHKHSQCYESAAAAAAAEQFLAAERCLDRQQRRRCRCEPFRGAAVAKLPVPWQQRRWNARYKPFRPEPWQQQRRWNAGQHASSSWSPRRSGPQRADCGGGDGLISAQRRSGKHVRCLHTINDTQRNKSTTNSEATPGDDRRRGPARA